MQLGLLERFEEILSHPWCILDMLWQAYQTAGSYKEIQALLETYLILEIECVADFGNLRQLGYNSFSLIISSILKSMTLEKCLFSVNSQ